MVTGYILPCLQLLHYRLGWRQLRGTTPFLCVQHWPPAWGLMAWAYETSGVLTVVD